MTSLFISSLALTTQLITTSVGPIAVHIRSGASTQPPIVFLHGVYYDHHLWNYTLSHLPEERTLIAIDMPLHGQSQQGILSHWTLEHCTALLVEVLDSLEVAKAVGIGHSWGSMTLLRAAHRHPERFAALGLCNMPLRASTPQRRWQFRMQHMMLPFRRFYTRQVAKALYGKGFEQQHPELLQHLQRSMGLLSNRAIRATDRAVILQADDGEALLRALRVPTLALKGEEDYVGTSDAIPYTIISGGHVSPLEQPEAVLKFVEAVLQLQAP